MIKLWHGLIVFIATPYIFYVISEYIDFGMFLIVHILVGMAITIAGIILAIDDKSRAFYNKELNK